MNNSVPSSVAPSTSNTVPILQTPNRGSMNTTLGLKEIPLVPLTEVGGKTPAQPPASSASTHSAHIDKGDSAPSVPGMNGHLFRAGPIDDHYQSEIQAHDPYRKVNNPKTRGMVSWIKAYLNGIATSQDVDNAGWKVRHGQQRTSYMRYTASNMRGIGYVGGEQFVPHQIPQTPHTQRFLPTVGTDQPGTYVLNSSQYGAGQTAGGVGGNNYTPASGPPQTTNVDGSGGGGMPTWG